MPKCLRCRFRLCLADHFWLKLANSGSKESFSVVSKPSKRSMAEVRLEGNRANEWLGMSGNDEGGSSLSDLKINTNSFSSHCCVDPQLEVYSLECLLYPCQH